MPEPEVENTDHNSDKFVEAMKKLFEVFDSNDSEWSKITNRLEAGMTSITAALSSHLEDDISEAWLTWSEERACGIIQAISGEEHQPALSREAAEMVLKLELCNAMFLGCIFGFGCIVNSYLKGKDK